MTEPAKPVVGQPLDKAEFNHLMTIIKERQTLVQTQLSQRAKEIEQALEVQVEAEFQPKIDEYKVKARKLHDKLKAVTEEIRELTAEAAVDKLHVSVSIARYADDDGVAVQPRDLHGEVQRRFQELKVLKGGAEVNFKLKTLETKEALILGQLTSPEARALLQGLPTIDELMPIQAEDVKLLTSGTKKRK